MEKYIIKNKISLKIISRYLQSYRSYKYIYEIIYLNGSNKYYGNKEKISLMKKICKINNIEYEIYENYIEVFIVTHNHIKYKEDNFLKEKYILIIFIMIYYILR